MGFQLNRILEKSTPDKAGVYELISWEQGVGHKVHLIADSVGRAREFCKKINPSELDPFNFGGFIILPSGGSWQSLDEKEIRKDAKAKAINACRGSENPWLRTWENSLK